MQYIFGLLFAFCAAVAFGIQYVPVKRYEIYDGITFQWFMCAGILMVGFVIAVAFGEFGLEDRQSLLIVAGGALWALSNYLVLPLVKLLGIGVGFSLYHFVNLVVGYAVGRFGLFGIRQLESNVLLCDGGCLLVLISFVVLVFVEKDEGQLHDTAYSVGGFGVSVASASDINIEAPNGLIENGPSNTVSNDDGHLPHEINSNPARPSTETLKSSASRIGVKLIGVVLAVLAGGLAGVQSVPATLYNQGHPSAPAVAAVFPQCLGIYICSSAIYVVYASVAKLTGRPVPHSTIRPAYLSGCIWGTGFAFMISAISVLGFSIGYTLDAVGPIVVASLLSIFVFKEIRGAKQLALYFCAFVCQLVGVIIMALFGNGG